MLTGWRPELVCQLAGLNKLRLQLRDDSINKVADTLALRIIITMYQLRDDSMNKVADTLAVRIITPCKGDYAIL
jgi:hypothetical protein